MQNTKYFHNQPHFRRIAEQYTPIMRYFEGSIQEWQKRAKEKLYELLGLNRMEPCDPQVVTTQTQELPNGLTRIRKEMHTEPDVIMPFYQILPKDYDETKKYPIIICPHGHGGGGKDATVGNAYSEFMKKTISNYNYDYAIQIAQLGCITFAPDARGFGERREAYVWGDEESKVLASSCQVLNNMALPLGQTVAGMWTHDLIQLMSYIQTLDVCDSAQVGCAGLSGGGLQTLYFSALDDRVKLAIVSGYFYGVKDSLLDMHLNCSCNYVPHLWENFDHGDLGGLICPRPLLIESGTQDELNGERGIINCVEQVEVTRYIYNQAGAESNLYHDIFEGPHKWHGNEALKWIQKHFNL